MCFAPERRALFPHLSLQKWKENVVWHIDFETTMACTFWTYQLPKVLQAEAFSTCLLRNVLRATTAGTFWTSQVRQVLRHWGVFSILTSKSASRHNGVQFFVSQLTRWLRTRRFSKPTFRPSEATKLWKNTVFRDFSTFSRTLILFLLTLSRVWSSFFFSSLLWLFPPLLFHLSKLSEVWLLNFLRSWVWDFQDCNIKLNEIIYIYINIKR